MSLRPSGTGRSCLPLIFYRGVWPITVRAQRRALRREGSVVKAVVLDSERYRVEIDLEDGQIAG